MEMLIRVFEEVELIEKRYYLILFFDINFNVIWVIYVVSMVLCFDVVFIGNFFVVQLFREKGYEVIVQLMFRKDIFFVIEIRRCMVEGEFWEEFVFRSVVEFIREIKGVERIKMFVMNLESLEKEFQVLIRILEF